MPDSPAPFRVCLTALALCCGICLHAGERPLDPDSPPEGRFVEDWMEMRVNQMKVGYAQMVLERRGDAVHTSLRTHMRIERSIVSISVASDLATVESVDGRPQSFEFGLDFGGEPMKASGRIADGNLLVKSTQHGMSQEQAYPWESGALMTWGSIRETLKRGLEPGTRYEFPLYSPDVSQGGALPTRITVGERESYAYRDARREGVRVDTVTTIPGSGMQVASVSWVNPATGIPIRTTMQMAGLDIDLHTCTQEQALSEFVPADIFTYSLIELGRAIPGGAREVTFRVDFEQALPEDLVWPSSRVQKIIEQEGDHVRVRVERASHRPYAGVVRRSVLKSSDSPYLASNAYMNLDDTQLEKLAQEAAQAGGFSRETPFIRKADALRRFVTDYVSGKNLTVGFGTASDVARSREGDCTEHAVLLAALGRLHEIPARLAVGLAYLPRFGEAENIMGFHMWTQFLIDGDWVDFDAALGESETSPIRIAMHTSSLEDQSIADVSLSLMHVIGQINVTVESIE